MNCRALLLLTTALAACSNVSGWSFSKGGDPPSQDEPLPSIDLPTAEHYWWNTITGKTQWEDPNPHLATDEGHRYYINQESGQTTWDKPPELAWLAANSDEHGREYYYNTVTKESVWEKPEALAWKKLPADGKTEL